MTTDHEASTNERGLRRGDPRIHDLVAEIDEAIQLGDEPRVEELTVRLHALSPNSGAGSDT